MKKLAISLITLLALLAAALPVAAAEEEEKKEPLKVPNVVQIEDPPGDANTYGGDWQSGNLLDDGDILRAWFSNDAETVTGHVQTATMPVGDVAYLFRLRANPVNALNPAGGCLLFEGVVAGGTNAGSSDAGELNDNCGEAAKVIPGEISIDEMPDGTAVISMTVARAESPMLEEGVVLFTPLSESRAFLGAGNGGLLQLVDNTKAGSDYTLIGEVVAPKKEEPAEGEEGEEEPEEEPAEEPEQSEPPKKKKGKKGKGCPPMTPHEKGADAETVVVTEEATEEKPIEIPVAAPQGVFPVSGGDVYQNIQVDTSGGEKGLFIRYEFPEYEDLDLYLYEAGNDEAVAQAAGFNQAPVVPGETDGTGNGGHSEMGAEQIDGHPSADCAGFTAEMHSFLTEGGEYLLKVWLADPAAEEEGMRSIYDSMLSLI